ncbi:MAG: hypothetical protein GVY27_13430 [Deinococcus-Thermus bacterium]|jgi:hypothetical protein|nr:hypothetical protein [Deinococcota bacterium]
MTKSDTRPGRFQAADGHAIAKADNTRAVVRRFGRGNVAVQNGDILDQADLETLRKEGDAAVARLRTYVDD